MSSFISQFSEVVNQGKKLVKQLKKKKLTWVDELEAIEKALSVQRSHNKKTSETIHTHDMWKFWLIGVFVILLGYFVFQSLDILYLILAWFILAMACENVVSRFQHRFSRWFSILATYVLLLLFLVSGLVIVVPFVIQQMADIVNVLLTKVNVLQNTIQTNGLAMVIEESFLPTQIKTSFLEIIQSGNRMESVQSSIVENISQIVSIWSNYITNAGSFAVSVVAWFFSAFVQVSIVFIVAIFFTIEKKEVIHFISRVSWDVTYTELKLKKLYSKLWFWLQWQLLLCVIIALMVWLWLTILGRFGIAIPNKFTLALIAWLTEFVPYVWPIIWMFPAVLLWWLTYGWTGILWVVIMYWIIQQTENNILVPMVMSQTLWVSPLLIFLCMVLWWSLFWILGIILAVPFAVIMNILFEDYIHIKKVHEKKEHRLKKHTK